MYLCECFRPDVNTFITPELRVIEQCRKKKTKKVFVDIFAEAFTCSARQRPVRD